MPAQFSPESLSEITSAEIVMLGNVDPNRVTEYMRAASEAPIVLVEGEKAQHLADLWRQLPPGQQARCHVPIFGLRFFAEGQLISEASVCWQCSNIYGESNGEAFCYEFNAEASASRQLLAEIRQITGIGADA